MQRVAVRRNHHTQCGTPIPLQLDVIQPSMRAGFSGGQQHIHQISFESQQNRLGLRVAHAAIELQRFGVSLGIDHQSGVQETGVGNAVFLHAPDRGQNDFAHGAGMHIGRHHRRR